MIVTNDGWEIGCEGEGGGGGGRRGGGGGNKEHDLPFA